MKKYSALGLMSGTSLDGLDICHCIFTENSAGKWQFKICAAETVPYDEFWENRLRNSAELSAEALLALNSDYGFFLGNAAKDFIVKNGITNLDIIASHGHTVFHQPEKKFTLQIGDGRAIKVVTGEKTVYDFRMQDILLGGNGAPLVPIGDVLLFTEFDACLNLGGFSNISYHEDGKRIAFDICPVNTVLNMLAEKFGKKYDTSGEIARSGTVNETVLRELNSIAYYEQAPPKSLGAEWLSENILQNISSLAPEDALATFTEHIAQQIVNVFSKSNFNEVLVTGGGAFNTFLIEKLRSGKTKIVVPDDNIVNYKEALIFAFMGVLKLLGRNNVLSSATGSAHDHSTGILI